MNIEQQIEELISKPLQEIGYLIVRIKFMGTKDLQTLQIMLERADEEKITVADCAKASRLISRIFEEVDPIKEQYNLEVSSTGIDRPLVKLADFVKYTGYEVKITTSELVVRRKKFTGKLVSVENEIINIKIPQELEVISINFAQIQSANLLITEELLRS
jgi:ribosome maturation factor RimP